MASNDSTIELSIIIPAYKEEENLRIILPRLNLVLENMDINYEIIIVDSNPSYDKTEQLCKVYNHVKYFHRENENTYGNAVRMGIHKCTGNKTIFMDADNSHSPEFIVDLYQNSEDYDVVVASRFVDGGDSDNSFTLKLMSKLVNMSYSLFFNLKCKDVSNSFKLYQTEQLKNITLSCTNFDIVEEILIKLKHKKKNFKIKEIPYLFKKRMFGHTKRNLISFIFSYIITIIKLKFIK